MFTAHKAAAAVYGYNYSQTTQGKTIKFLVDSDSIYSYLFQ